MYSSVSIKTKLLPFQITLVPNGLASGETKTVAFETLLAYFYAGLLQSFPHFAFIPRSEIIGNGQIGCL